MRTSASLRLQNAQQIHALTLLEGSVTRHRLAERTGLTGAAISRITRELISAGALLEQSRTAATGRLGRREVQLSINPDYSLVLGITITGDRRALALADAAGHTVAEADISHIDLSDPAASLAAIGAATIAFVRDADCDPGLIAGAGVSMSILASGSTEYVSAPPLNWENVAVRQSLQRALGLPVRVEARATSMLRAELLQRSQPPSSLFLLNVAYGVGSSAYLNHQLVQPSTAGFGGVSHFVVRGDLTPCHCGRRGCIEVCAGGRRVLATLGRQSKDFATRNNNIKCCLADADAGEAGAVAALRDAGAQLAYVVDAILSLFDPAQVVLSGEIGRQAHYRDGLLAELASLGLDQLDSRITQSAVTSNEAAVWLAVETFLAPALIAVKVGEDRL